MNSSSPIETAISLLEGGASDLGRSDTRASVAQVMRGEASDPQIVKFLQLLSQRGESADEIAGGVDALLESSVPFPVEGSDLVDTCGTGGDGMGTFNISTASALVAASGGVHVAKHGNRSVSSRCGSADCLEAMKIPIDLGPDAAARMLRETGFVFLFAPRYHPAMKHAAGPRKTLGIRTLFNFLGPLANPARTGRQLLGVFSPDRVEDFARVLASLGKKRALVISGYEGIDEATPLGPIRMAEVVRGEILRVMDLDPKDLGLARCQIEDLAGGEPDEGARIVCNILEGEIGPKADAVHLGAALTFLVADRVKSLEEGIALSRDLIRDGKALRYLNQLQDYRA